MAKISFSKKFAVKKNVRLDKLTLDKEEKARIALVGDLEAQFIHQLTKIVLDEDTGEVVEQSVPRKDGTEYTKPVEKFVAKYVCTGDYDTVAEHGTDSKNCLFCEAAEQSGAFKPPRRYSVVQVFKYKTKPGAFTPASGPFQGEIIPWIFADGKWNQIADIEEEYQEQGGVMAMDLNLGPCKDPAFQNYDVKAGSECFYRKDPKRVEYVQELLEAYEGDISTLFGKVASEVEAKKVIREIQDTYDAGMNPRGNSNTDRLSSASREATDALFGADDSDDVADDEEDESGDEALEVRSFDELLDAE